MWTSIVGILDRAAKTLRGCIAIFLASTGRHYPVKSRGGQGKFNMLRVSPSRIEVIDEELAAVLRQKTPAERVEMIGAANRTARVLAAAGVRYQHPDWDDEQVQAEVIRRVCGGTNRPT
jgi:hypothetical protein